MTCQSSLAQEMNLIMKCTCTELAELVALAEKVKLFLWFSFVQKGKKKCRGYNSMFSKSSINK